ncbi:AIR synthase family protein [Herbinix luporum]|jgi:hydrogenase maturation factor|uniref:AIR synthase family protein n=1 Tax=Herbinix luporum TaxID=1679721 RepID=UPI0017678D0B|nr:AIR synthase family protein [Herbinix luporum]HHT56051.1 hydrogenase maturation factor [Herbinix luporum]
MKIGKIHETILKRSVLNQIKHRRDEVLLGPAIGKNCSIIDLNGEDLLAVSTNPLKDIMNNTGILAVHKTVNNIASSGAEPIGITLSILLPEDTEESSLKVLIHDVDMVCKELNIEVFGVEAEVTKVVNKPVLTVTGVGRLKKSDIEKGLAAIPGQEIVMTKWVGLEGTAILAKAKEEELLSRYSAAFINGAKSMLDYISVLPEVKIANQVGVTSMHNVTEGGIFGALWELGAAFKVGLEVDLQKILLKQETVEICEYFDLNPYMLISGGCLLMVTDKANFLVESLREEGIEAAVIGRIKEGNDRLVKNNDELRFLEPSQSDELYKVI